MGMELVVGVFMLIWVVRNLNWWLYEMKLGNKVRHQLPPGDLGWPIIGNMRSLLRAFNSPNPESFLDSFVKRFGATGLYKVHMYGSPSIVVTTPEASRKVLTDDESFKQGWPASTITLMGRKSFSGADISNEEHKWLRKLTAAPINGSESLSVYTKYIEQNVVTALDEWADRGQIEFLTEMRSLALKILMHVFISSEGERVQVALEREYSQLKGGMRAMAINLPGFAYYKALKARENLVGIFQGIVSKRRENPSSDVDKDMMDALLDAEDENGRKLDDESVIDILIMYLNTGHESSGYGVMWATRFLQKNPDMFKRAKAEQEEVLRNRPAGQKGLTLREIRKMDYLTKVIDETLRLITLSIFREAKKDVNIGGYIIPKGWKAIVWFRSLHYDHKSWSDPYKFDPSRWDDHKPKAGNFIPFGYGRRLCPGNELAKLQIYVFLHYFLLNYELELNDPDCPVVYLPIARPKDNCLGKFRRVSTQTS